MAVGECVAGTYVVIEPGKVMGDVRVLQDRLAQPGSHAFVQLCGVLSTWSEDAAPSPLNVGTEADRPVVAETWAVSIAWLSAAMTSGFDDRLGRRLTVVLDWPPSPDTEMTLLLARLSFPSLRLSVKGYADEPDEVFDYFNRLGFAWAMVVDGTPGEAAAPSRANPTGALVLSGAHLVDPGRGATIADAVVVIRDGRIAAAGPSATTGVPPDARILDTRGKWIVPALIDMHVHYEPWMDPLFVRHGVVTVRDVGSNPVRIHADRAASRRPDAVGPRIFTCGPLLDGPSPRWGPERSVSVSTEAEARAAAAELAEQQRVDCFKLYERLSPPLVRVLVGEGQRFGVPVTAHLAATSAREGIEAGIQGIEHLSGLDYRRCPPADFDDVLRRIVERGVYVVPTLVQMERLSRLHADDGGPPLLGEVPDAARRFWAAERARRPLRVSRAADARLACRKMLVGRLAEGGASIVTGSDTPNPYVVPGESVLRELELLVESGVTPRAALRAATSTAAAFLGERDRLGGLVPGMAADLVVLSANPLVDIANVRAIELVLREGRVVWPARGPLPAGR